MHSKALIFAAVLACAFAADTAPSPAPKEDERVKKDVLLGTVPYAYAPSAYVPSRYLYDDGHYYPGKYEKAYVAAPAVSPYAAVPSYASVPSYAAVPSYAVPAVSSYSAVHHVAPSYVAPSYVAGYPYVNSYVY